MDGQQKPDPIAHRLREIKRKIELQYGQSAVTHFEQQIEPGIKRLTWFAFFGQYVCEEYCNGWNGLDFYCECGKCCCDWAYEKGRWFAQGNS